ncbi:hypothetical protein HU200_037958 [Digitaria exilis]|uniref:PIN-like protein n=1 Tax=Digitaria exilis TaxID=1010633 RepID=A0A835BDC9_9POAL|nr:hypothetical protein HU200_037958 [Digitaria exilis]
MGLLELFVTACVPVLNMLLVTGVGSFLASDFASILTKEARKHLNNLVFYVFNPSLIATYLAKTITMESLGELWFMPVNILLSSILGLFFGWILIKVTRAPAKLKGLILGCCSAVNLLGWLQIVGLILGATPLLKKSLIGANAPLRALQESAELIGGAAVPAVTLIMGGNLLKGVRGKASVQPSVIAGIVAVRYVLLPLLGPAVVKGAAHLRLIQPDPLYQFILLLQYAVPPAMNIGTMTQLFGVGESECAVIFVWAYALASAAVTAWSAFFLWTLSP